MNGTLSVRFFAVSLLMTTGLEAIASAASGVIAIFRDSGPAPAAPGGIRMNRQL
jgi:hypothetical protein